MAGRRGCQGTVTTTPNDTRESRDPRTPALTDDAPCQLTAAARRLERSRADAIMPASSIVRATTAIAANAGMARAGTPI